MDFIMLGTLKLGHAVRRLMVLLALLLPGAWAHAASTDAAARVNRLMEASGINHAVNQVLPGILGGFDDAQQQQQPMPLQVRAAMRDAATQGFQTAPMLEKVRAKLGELNEKQFDDTLRWLDTPLGRRITELENSANEPAAMQKIEAYAQERQKQPAPRSRMRLIQDLNRVTGAQEMSNNIMEAIMLATALGMNAAQPREQQTSPEALRKEIKSSMPDIQKQTEQFVTSSMLYTYRPLTDKELEAYLQFSRSASGTAYNKSATAGMSDALLEAIGRFMTAIPKAMERTKGAAGA
jgi:hypothetical protein